jgi:diguanylate cyclase
MTAPSEPLQQAASLLRSGRLGEAMRVTEAFLAERERLPAQRLQALLLLIAAQEQQGLLEAAVQTADEAGALAQALGDRAGGVEVHCAKAGIFNGLGLQRESFESATAALAQARELDDPRLEGLALRHMAGRATSNGDEEEARRLLEQSLACARTAGSDADAFWALNNLSHLLGMQAARQAEAGRREAASAIVAELVHIVQQALSLARRTGHWLHQAFALSNMADAYIVEGDHRRARELIAEYAAIARQHGFVRLLAYANLDEARLLRAEARGAEAIARVDAQRHRDLLVGSDDLVLTTEQMLYELHKGAGQFEDALRHLEITSELTRVQMTRAAEQQVRVMVARLDLAQARLATDRARLDAQLSAHRAQALEQEREHLQRAAREDSLTGVGNRRAADDVLATVLSEAQTGREHLFVALADIDHFKQVNDVYGHATGDTVLSALGLLMRQFLRSRDHVFRYGGEEFLLLLTDDAPQAGQDACERLRRSIEVFDWPGVSAGLRVTASFGVTQCDPAGDTPHTLLARADAALYAAKRSGRNRVCLA